MVDTSQSEYGESKNAYRTFYAISSGKCKKGKIVKLPPNAGLKSEFVAILSYGGA
jgi:hypothetical protein